MIGSRPRRQRPPSPGGSSRTVISNTNLVTRGDGQNQPPSAHATGPAPCVLFGVQFLDADQGSKFERRLTRSILKNGLDRAFLDDTPDHQPLRHGNIRGQGYFH